MGKSFFGIETFINYFLIFALVNARFADFGHETSNKFEIVESQFQEFLTKYNKSYSLGSVEYFKRLKIFESNLVLHAKLNTFRSHPESAIYGVNKFSDLTQDEFKERYLNGMKMKHTNRLSRIYGHTLPITPKQKLVEIPKILDWRDRHIITEPRDQKNCGGCWAFANVETIESMYAQRTGKLIPLSVQEMIDCSLGFSPMLNGCSGGDTCAALDWAFKMQTVFVPESSYPFVYRSQICQMNKKINETRGPIVSGYNCSSFVGREDELLKQIFVGPLSVSVDASNWNNYQGGIIQFHCGEVPRNHAVQIVGYDLSGPIPYYIAKNSWGADFGHGGYVYIKYSSNTCLIAEEVSSVQVSG